jgi:hypothetical protein
MRRRRQRIRCGIFGIDWRKSAGSSVGPPHAPRKSEDFPTSTVAEAGAALALKSGEHHVFRAALFSIVLTLAVGQNAGLLCTVWCVPHDATSALCPHQDPMTSPTVRGDDNCSDPVTLGTVAFVREDGRRTAPGPDLQNALVVLRFRFVAPSIDPRPGYESARRSLLEERPLTIALRI